MAINLNLKSICLPSENVIAREIGDELLIVPLVAGMVDGDDALYTLSPTAQMIWKHLDGKNTLQDIIEVLSLSFDEENDEISKDVFGFITEMNEYEIISVING